MESHETHARGANEVSGHVLHVVGVSCVHSSQVEGSRFSNKS